jgi:hypothetical protein
MKRWRIVRGPIKGRGIEMNFIRPSHRPVGQRTAASGAVTSLNTRRRTEETSRSAPEDHRALVEAHECRHRRSRRTTTAVAMTIRTPKRRTDDDESHRSAKTSPDIIRNGRHAMSRLDLILAVNAHFSFKGAVSADRLTTLIGLPVESSHAHSREPSDPLDRSAVATALESPCEVNSQYPAR